MSFKIIGAGPTVDRTFTFPDANATVLTDNAAVTAAQGGTGIASYAVGDLLYASAATTLSKLTAVAAGSYLRSGGLATAPLWSTLVLPNAAVAGDLIVATSTNTLGSVADVAVGQVLTSGGVGAVPSWSPNLTLTSLTTTAGVTVGTSLVVSGVGPHAIGGTISSNAQFINRGTFAPSAGNDAIGLYIISSMAPAVSKQGYLQLIQGSFTTPASGTTPLLAGLYIDASPIAAGGASLTNTASLYIAGAMAATVTGANYAMWIAAGSVRMGGYGAGTATFDASGNITSVSDARLKTNVRDYTYGLASVRKLRPVLYNWNEESHLDREHDYAGFIAQEVEAVLGATSVGQDERGYLSLQERAIVGATVKAIQELADRMDRLETR